MSIATKSAVCGLVVLIASLGAAQAAPGTVSGTWQPQKIQFHYFGFTTIYSCNGLADNLRVLLKASGARDIKVTSSGCAGDYGRPDKFARAQLQFSTLKPATSTAAAGGSTPAAAPVDAQWHSVKLGPFSPQPLESGNCELVEQFSKVVLPLFATRAIKINTRCTPHQNPVSFSVTFQTLAPVEPAEAP